jgi:hypothetical protein
MEEGGSSSWEVIEKKRKFRQARQKEYDAEKERIRKKHVQNHPDPQVIPFLEKPFGPLPFDETPFFKRSIVSIGLFNGTVHDYYSATNKLACGFFCRFIFTRPSD